MIGGRICRPSRQTCIRAHGPDIDRAAERVSRAASAAVAGAADAGVRARHRAWRGRRGRQLRARGVAQDRARHGRADQGPHGRSGAPAVPSAGTVPDRRQFPEASGANPPCIVVAGLAMADPRRRARCRRANFEAALNATRDSDKSGALEVAIRTFQRDAAEAIGKLLADGDRRLLARVGGPEVLEDLLPIGAVLQAREALDTLNGRLPTHFRMFGETADRVGRRRAECSCACRRRSYCRSRCRW